MARNPKCKVCKEEINKNIASDFTKKHDGYYHNTCLEKKKVEKSKAKLSPKEESKETKEVKKKTKQAEKTCLFCKEGFSDEEQILKRGSMIFHEWCLENYRSAKKDELDIKVRMRTCPRCKEQVNPLDEDSIEHSGNTLHGKCYDKLIREKRNREALCDYISIVYNIEFPTGFMLKQINEYYEVRGYSYKAMLVTLKYMFEVEKVQVKDGTGIGLLPYFYEKAKKYHTNLIVARNSATNINIKNDVVRVNAVAPTRRTKAGYIDIASL